MDDTLTPETRPPNVGDLAICGKMEQPIWAAAPPHKTKDYCVQPDPRCSMYAIYLPLHLSSCVG